MGSTDERRIADRINRRYYTIYAYRRRFNKRYRQEADIFVDGYLIKDNKFYEVRLMIEEKTTSNKTYYFRNLGEQFGNMLDYSKKMLRVPYIVVVFKKGDGKYVYAFKSLLKSKMYDKLTVNDGYEKISEFVEKLIDDGIKEYNEMVERIKENEINEFW